MKLTLIEVDAADQKPIDKTLGWLRSVETLKYRISFVFKVKLLDSRAVKASNFALVKT